MGRGGGVLVGRGGEARDARGTLEGGEREG